MRIKVTKTKVYPFSELSETAKEKAIEQCCEFQVDYEWWHSVYDDAEQNGLKLREFNIDRASYCRGEFIENAKDTAKKIIENHGETCETFQTAENYGKECASLWQVLPEKLDDDGYDENETARDDEQEDLDSEFLKSLLEDYRIILQKEYEYLTSEKVIIEMIEVNEYEFTEEGKLA